MDRWELDNLERGAKDIDLGPLEEAVKKMAAYEDNAIYNGLDKGGIRGLTEVSNQAVALGEDASSILKAVSQASILLRKAYSEPS